MIELKQWEAWFITGSQHLYGPETLKQVAEDSKKIAAALSRSKSIPVKVVFKPVVTTPDAILEVCRAANNATNCIGLITWMHTFSPAKMWINGLKALTKPQLHLHTQFNRDIPWSDIDMDFMNLNQSAHGDREYGFINSRMRLDRKVVVGFWQEEQIQERIGIWCRVACAWQDAQTLKIARFGDNMREVAVTDGDKVAAQIQFGYSVNGYGLGDLAKVMQSIEEKAVDQLVAEYEDSYILSPSLQKNGNQRPSLRTAAKIELASGLFSKPATLKATPTLSRIFTVWTNSRASLLKG